MKEFWNERYNRESYIYGEQPNVFFKQAIDNIETGRILLPAEGEGRNAVYAAGKGWQVEAFDQSEQGKAKAMRLADILNVEISYKIQETDDISYVSESFDAIAFIYSHVPIDIKYDFHSRLLPYLRVGGYIILEGFSKGHIKHQKDNPQAGGPRNIDMLYSKEEILQSFPYVDILTLEEEDIVLSEGMGHQGKSSVIRFLARKR